MKLYNMNKSLYGIYDDTSWENELYSYDDYTIYDGKTNDNYFFRIRGYDTLWSFLSSFIITLMLICLAAGLLFVDKSARESAGMYENFETQAELARLLGQMSALRWTVRGIFPYFILVVELLLLLCRLFSIIAKAIF